MQLASRRTISYNERQCTGVTVSLLTCTLQAPGLNIFLGQRLCFFFNLIPSVSTKILGIIPKFHPCNEDKNILTRKASKPQYQLLAAS
jgi:hypothetical protein